MGIVGYKNHRSTRNFFQLNISIEICINEKEGVECQVCLLLTVNGAFHAKCICVVIQDEGDCILSEYPFFISSIFTAIVNCWGEL